MVDVGPLVGRPEGAPDLSSPEVIREIEFAELLAKLALGLAGARLKRFMSMLCGWPAKSVLMRTGNSGAGAQAALDLKRHHANWLALKDQTTVRFESTQHPLDSITYVSAQCLRHLGSNGFVTLLATRTPPALKPRRSTGALASTM